MRKHSKPVHLLLRLLGYMIAAPLIIIAVLAAPFSQ